MPLSYSQRGMWLVHYWEFRPAYFTVLWLWVWFQLDSINGIRVHWISDGKVMGSIPVESTNGIVIEQHKHCFELFTLSSKICLYT